MGRFYNTTDLPHFVEGLYTPPLEMMDKALSYNQQGYDNALASANLFKDLDIKYIDDPIVKSQVEAVQKYYTDKVDQITSAIQKDPLAWKKSTLPMQNLSRELQKDVKEGDIARFQNSYQSLVNFIDNHKEYKQKFGGDYNRAYQYFLKEWQNDPLRMKGFNWEQLANPIDTEAIHKRIKDMAANATETVNGNWIVGNKTVTKDRIEAAAREQILAEPQNLAYVQQQVKFQNPEYYDERYAKVFPNSGGFYESMYLTTDIDPKTGQQKVLTDAEATELQAKYIKDVQKYKEDEEAYIKKLKKGDKNAVAPEIPQRAFYKKNGAVGNIIDTMVNEHAYFESTLKANPVALANLHIQANKELQNQRLSFEREKFEFEKGLKNQANNINLLGKINTAMTGLDPVKDKAELNSLREVRGKIITGLLTGYIAENNPENPKGAITEFNLNKNVGGFEGGDASRPWLMFNGAKDYNPTTGDLIQHPFSNNIPTTFENLYLSKDDNNKRNSNLYADEYKKVTEAVGKRFKNNATQKRLAEEFLKFYDKNGGDFEESYNLFMNRKLESGALTNTATGKKLTKEDITLAGGYEAEHPVQGSKIIPTRNNSAYTKLKNDIFDGLQNVIAESDKRLKEYGKSQVGSLRGVQVTDWGSKEYLKQIYANPTAFTVLEIRDVNGMLTPVGKEVDKESVQKKIDSNKWTIKTSLMGGFAGLDNVSVIQDASGKQYIVYPEGESNVGSMSPVIENLRNQVWTNPSYTNSTSSAQFKELNNPKNSVGIQANEMLSAINSVPYKGDTNSGTVKSSVDYKYITPKGSVPIRVTRNNGRFNAIMPDGEPLLLQPTDDIYVLSQFIQEYLK